MTREVANEVASRPLFLARFNLGWVPHAFSLEIRKVLSYRVDFWLNFGGTVAVQLAVAYFLWRAIFDANGVDTMGGFGFSALMLYYVMVPLVDRMVRGQEMNFLSGEIYDGTLTRYLIYPISVLGYKYVAHLSAAGLFLLQLLLALGAFALLVGLPPDRTLSPWSFAAGIIAALGAGIMYFLLACALEMIAFWADNVWSILLILRFAIHFLGGGLIPLSFFPEWFEAGSAYLPFVYMLGFPVRAFLGEIAPGELLFGLGVILFWTSVFGTVASVIWRRGLRQYTGVGI